MKKTHENELGTMVVPMLDPEIVERIRLLQQLRWGSKRIARELGVARNRVRRYLRGGAAVAVQARPNGRTLDADQAALASELPGGHFDYWFWPRLREAEPDIVLEVGATLIVIDSGKSGGATAPSTRLPRPWHPRPVTPRRTTYCVNGARSYQMA